MATSLSPRDPRRVRYWKVQSIDMLLTLLWMMHIIACWWNKLGNATEENAERFAGNVDISVQIIAYMCVCTCA